MNKEKKKTILLRTNNTDNLLIVLAFLEAMDLRHYTSGDSSVLCWSGISSHFQECLNV